MSEDTKEKIVEGAVERDAGATTLMVDATCPPLARAAVFVHPRPPLVKPKFTG